jgi:hypothetical protein
MGVSLIIHNKTKNTFFHKRVTVFFNERVTDLKLFCDRVTEKGLSTAGSAYKVRSVLQGPHPERPSRSGASCFLFCVEFCFFVLYSSIFLFDSFV